MLFLVSSEGVPSVARWVHVQGTFSAPAASFGTDTRVKILHGPIWLHNRAVLVNVSNGNKFAVPAHATLRLKGDAAQRASLSSPVATDVVLPANRSESIRIKLGEKRSRFIRKHGGAQVLVKLSVRDPAGHARTVQRTLTVKPA
jgi:hypothetical protein